jgi:hypothetical protein
MRWTSGASLAVGALALSGCVYGYQNVAPAAQYSMDSRPDGSYYCYDCHGYRFFDPYYDYCSYYGSLPLGRHPHERRLSPALPRIRTAHPEYGRYRYREDYRASTRYRVPASYEEFRREESGDRARDADMERHDRRRPEWKERKGRGEGKKDRDPDDGRDGGGQQPSDQAPRSKR